MLKNEVVLDRTPKPKTTKNHWFIDSRTVQDLSNTFGDHIWFVQQKVVIHGEEIVLK